MGRRSRLPLVGCLLLCISSLLVTTEAQALFLPNPFKALKRGINSLKRAGQRVFRAVKKTARKVFRAARRTAKKVFRGARKTARKVFRAARKTARKVFRAARRTAKRVAKGVGKLVGKLGGPLAKVLQFLRDLKIPFKLPPFPKSLRDLVSSFLKAGKAPMAMLRYFYDRVLRKQFGDLPAFRTFEKLLRGAKRFITDLIRRGPGETFGALIQGLTKRVTAFFPTVMKHVMGLRSEMRKLLVLELKSVSDKRHDRRLGAFVNKVLAPLEKPLASLLRAFLPAPFVDFLQKIVSRPIHQAALQSFRMILVARGALKNVARVLLPWIMEGTVGFHRALKKLRPPPFVKKVLLAAFDKLHGLFGGIGAFLLSATPELKQTVERVLDGVVGAFDQVKGAMGQLTALSGNSAEALLASFEKLTGGSGGAKVDRAALQRAQASLAAAKKRADAAAAALRQAKKAAVDAAGKGDARRGHAARDRVARAEKALAAAQDKLRLAAGTLERADPSQVSERVLVSVSEAMVGALMKATWDPLAAVSEAISGGMIFVVDVVLSIVGAVLGVIPFTTTYGPLIVSVVQVVVGAVLSILKSLFFSMILPEARVLLEDQLQDVKTILVEMWRNPRQRSRIKAFGKVIQEVFADLRGFGERLRKVRDTVKLGAAALLVGPLGKIFKGLPPQLFVAISAAISKGMQLLQEAATQAAIGLVKAVGKSRQAGGKRLSARDIVRAIIGALREPLIDFMTSLIPDPTLSAALKKGLTAATARAEREANPVKLLNPRSVLAMIGEGLRNAKVELAAFLTRGWKVPGLATSVERGIEATGKALTDLGQVSKLLRGGVMGVLRKVVYVVKPALMGLLTKDLPADLAPSFRQAYEKAFRLIEEPGLFARVIGQGLRGVVAKVVEIAHRPITELIVRELPGPAVKQAVRSVLSSLGRRASSARFFDALTRRGIPGLAAQILGEPQVARALARLLTAEWGDARLTREVEAGIPRAARELDSARFKSDFLKRGVRSLLAHLVKPVAAYLIRRLTGEITVAPLRDAVRAALENGLAELSAGKDLVSALRSVGRTVFARVKLALGKLLAQAQRLFRQGRTAIENTLRELRATLDSSMATARQVAELGPLLGRLSREVAAAKVSGAALQEVLR